MAVLIESITGIARDVHESPWILPYLELTQGGVSLKAAVERAVGFKSERWLYKGREWRNWQTHYFEVVALRGVGVQVPPPAHKNDEV